jgi:hypothetical protein
MRMGEWENACMHVWLLADLPPSVPDRGEMRERRPEDYLLPLIGHITYAL